MSGSLDYYYEGQSEQFSFYRIPKIFFTDPAYSGLSTDAKLLYGFMLDRMGVSAKNGWLDDNGRVYIIFSIESIMSELGCGHDKAVKLLDELEKNCGLIERRRAGVGRPNLIYVKNFISGPSGSGLKNPKNGIENSEKRNPEFRKTESQFRKTESRIPKNGIENSEKRNPEFRKTEGNYTNSNYINKSYINFNKTECECKAAEENLTAENQKAEAEKHTPTPACCGNFKNVHLTEEELARLKGKLPYDYEELIERLSEYKESTGKEYKSDYATILHWSRDSERAGGKKIPKYGDPDYYAYEEGEGLCFSN